MPIVIPVLPAVLVVAAHSSAASAGSCVTSFRHEIALTRHVAVIHTLTHSHTNSHTHTQAATHRNKVRLLLKLSLASFLAKVRDGTLSVASLSVQSMFPD